MTMKKVFVANMIAMSFAILAVSNTALAAVAVFYAPYGGGSWGTLLANRSGVNSVAYGTNANPATGLMYAYVNIIAGPGVGAGAVIDSVKIATPTWKFTGKTGQYRIVFTFSVSGKAGAWGSISSFLSGVNCLTTVLLNGQTIDASTGYVAGSGQTTVQDTHWPPIPSIKTYSNNVYAAAFYVTLYSGRTYRFLAELYVKGGAAALGIAMTYSYAQLSVVMKSVTIG
jgi:hypothetical protein